jgi:hypothetical protein
VTSCYSYSNDMMSIYNDCHTYHRNQNFANAKVQVKSVNKSAAN